MIRRSATPPAGSPEPVPAGANGLKLRGSLKELLVSIDPDMARTALGKLEDAGIEKVSKLLVLRKAELAAVLIEANLLIVDRALLNNRLEPHLAPTV